MVSIKPWSFQNGIIYENTKRNGHSIVYMQEPIYPLGSKSTPKLLNRVNSTCNHFFFNGNVFFFCFYAVCQVKYVYTYIIIIYLSSLPISKQCISQVFGADELIKQQSFGVMHHQWIQSPPKESIHFCRAEYSKLRGGRWKVGGAPNPPLSPPRFWVLGFAASVYFLSVETVHVLVYYIAIILLNKYPINNNIQHVINKDVVITQLAPPRGLIKTL